MQNPSILKVQKEKVAADKAQKEAELALQNALAALAKANKKKEMAVEHAAGIATEKER